MIDSQEINSVESHGITFKVKHRYNPLKAFKLVAVNLAFVIFVVFATRNFYIKKSACEKNCEFEFCSPYGLLLLLTVVVYLHLFYSKIIKRLFGKVLSENVIEPSSDFLRKIFTRPVKIVLVWIIFTALLAYLVGYETRNDHHRLRSLVGIVSFFVIGYVFSYDKYSIKWRPVICGFLLQLLLGIVCIRWEVGRMVFKCFGDKITEFLNYAKEGASFVYGDFLVFKESAFAFTVLPTIFFFSFCISGLHYLGAMQWILLKIGGLLQGILGTTVCESVIAAADMFLGMSEAPLIIKPYIQFLTHSELHSVMVSGFSTVSGSVLVAYILYGAEAEHLITGSVMAAPASLFFSKLFFPEIEKSLTTSGNIQIVKSTDTSILDAVSNGARSGIDLCLSIAANLIAFIAFFAFADGIVKWATFLLGFNDVGFEFILGKMFIPISYALGVEWKDCEAVGHVIGTKTIINELVAYRLLGEYKTAGEISARSSAIATYAICGFGNPSAMGIMIGALSALAPERRPSITKVAFRAFIAGCIVSLMTASIAGLLMTDEIIAKSHTTRMFPKNSTKVG